MSDLISRSALIEVITKYKFGGISNDVEREYTKETVLQFISTTPTVEAKPVVHGKWVEVFDGSDYDGTYECSKCGKWLVLIEGIPEENHYDFCPFCGCSMKKE